MTIPANLFDDVARIVSDRLGESVTYTPAGESPVVIDAPFDEAFELVEMSAGVPISSVAPMLFVRLADLPVAPSKGDQVVARSVTYDVIDVQPDGQAGAECILHQVSP